ncbi:MAG: hypothetical protein GIX03_10395 [Candidatus Eremiobacteraeota bacterium]|nr:hypothetical protein [Candidatus Eremiobacteraeota bacterium]MBC5804995.1 hypothetical protein [Candidatus Eremiobacteraeota bacterium]MBC5820674.1 hypothetical protein [Candidatus Eremiobacteraeota bacterium]
MNANDRDPLSDYGVTIHYSKGSDSLTFRTKERAAQAIKTLKADVAGSSYADFVSVTDDDNNTIDFKARDFVRAVTHAPMS